MQSKPNTVFSHDLPQNATVCGWTITIERALGTRPAFFCKFRWRSQRVIHRSHRSSEVLFVALVCCTRASARNVLPLPFGYCSLFFSHTLSPRALARASTLHLCTVADCFAIYCSFPWGVWRVRSHTTRSFYPLDIVAAPFLKVSAHARYRDALAHHGEEYYLKKNIWNDRPGIRKSSLQGSQYFMYAVFGVHYKKTGCPFQITHHFLRFQQNSGPIRMEWQSLKSLLC